MCVFYFLAGWWWLSHPGSAKGSYTALNIKTLIKFCCKSLCQVSQCCRGRHRAMALKREISKSLANLHNSVKRLHIDDTVIDLEEDSSFFGEHKSEHHINYSITSPMEPSLKFAAPEHHPLTSVVSRAGADFGAKYEIQQEIGRGGFSVVYQCRSIVSGKSYAVKIIDLRPLRLRDSFDAMRLRREVDIMRQLRHPHIVQFEEVFESPDQLFVVMEYAPGYELFDAILSRGHFSESDAMPIFSQIARALLYLHNMNIIHRDIKPENVLVLKDPDPVTGAPVAKLLDFGLSKHTGLGSEAKTFVGTPCYLAPEVEFASKGSGATYGAPADCWSLGAVLYVMLVARFPVFEVDTSSTPPTTRLALPSELFRNSSQEAKELLRGLMCFDANKRLTMKQALSHPWLASQYRMTNDELVKMHVGALPIPLYLEPSRLQPPTPAQDSLVTSMELVRRVNDATKASPTASMRQLAKGVDQLGLTPLLHFQSNIAACFDDALSAYQFMPEVATEIRRGADLCRRQLQESTKMLRKIEQTACSVLEMFPDLELAIGEGEPELAMKFFGMMKGWVTDLMLLVDRTQSANRASMEQIQRIVERSTQEMHSSMLQRDVQESLSSLAVGGKGPLAGSAVNADFLFKMKKLLGVVLKKKDNIDPVVGGSGEVDEISEVLSPSIDNSVNDSEISVKSESMEYQLLQLFDIMLGRVLEGQDVSNERAIEYHPGASEKISAMDIEKHDHAAAQTSVFVEDDMLDESFENLGEETDIRSASAFSSEAGDSLHAEARKELQHALAMLRQVISRQRSKF